MRGYTVPSDLTVAELVKQFKDGWLQIPEVQRDVVWKPEKVAKLFNSIQSDYPCGSLIVWEPGPEETRFICDLVRPEILQGYRALDKDYRPKQFLVDGQQRLTALTALAYGTEYLRTREPEAEYDWPDFYVNLKKPLEARTVDADDKIPKFPWVRSEDFYAGAFESHPEFAQFDEAMRSKIQQYRDKFRGYRFPIQIIKEFNYATVGEVFARVNSEGTPLEGAEIHIARIIPHWRGITKDFRAFLHELDGSRNYELDLTFLVRCLTVLRTKGPRIARFSDMVADGRVRRPELDRLWRECKSGIRKLIGILQKYGWQDRSKYFTSKNVLVPLVYFLCKDHSRKPRWKSIVQYFYMAQLGEHYSHGTEGVLRGDLKELANGTNIADGLRGLCDTARADARRHRRLKGYALPMDEISGPPSKNPILTLMYAVTRRADARDFGPGVCPTLDKIPPDDMQVHHIFPSETLRTDSAFQKYCRDEELKPSEVTALVNDAANLTFLSRGQNASIGDYAPCQYLQNATGRANLKAHFIPQDRELWKTVNYAEFIAARRRLLKKAVNSYLRSLR